MQKEPSILHDVVKKVSKMPQDAAYAKGTFDTARRSKEGFQNVAGCGVCKRNLRYYTT